MARSLRSFGHVLAVLALAAALPGCGALGLGSTSRSPAPAVTVTVTAAPSTSGAATSSIAPPSATGSATASASSAPTLQQAYEQVKSGVVRFEVAGCDFNATGSGFAISSRLVVTAAHVVTDGAVIRVIQGTTSTAGRVIGIDPGADVALVQTTSALSGSTLALSTRAVHVGDEVAAIGFPEGDPLSFNSGHVNGLDRKAVIDGIPRHSMIELDAATTHGSSGGPVINAAGDVVGLVDAGPDGEPGRRLAVSSSTARPLVTKWSGSPRPPAATDCSSAVGPDGKVVANVEDPSLAQIQAINTLAVYFGSINGGDFPTALAQLVQPLNLADFRKRVTSSEDAEFYVHSVRTVNGAPVVWLSFVSTQEKGNGPAGRPNETCTSWSLDYHFQFKRGLWLIKTTSSHAGQRTNQSC